MAALAAQFMKRMKTILEDEGVSYEEMAVADLIMKFAPDWRRVINECQRYSMTGFIDSGVTKNLTNDNYDDLFKMLKDKDFKKMRSWVANNIDTDAVAIFRAIYDRALAKVKPESLPQLILILADYQYKNAFAADHELNVVACMTEVMANIEFQ